MGTPNDELMASGFQLIVQRSHFIAMLQDGEAKTHLTEEANTKESLHLLGAGDLAAAELLARLEDRPQRVAALAAVGRGEAGRLEQKDTFEKKSVLPSAAPAGAP